MTANVAVAAAFSIPSPSWPDEELVAACRAGDETAWAVLVEKYRNLVYSVPVRYRLTPQDTADIFQAVWTDLLAELPTLRSPAALRSWLMKVAAHKCYHHKRRMRRVESIADEDKLIDLSDPPGFPELAQQLEKEQMLREALLEMPPRCRRIVQMLFFDQPPRPYRDVAAELDLAEGSIGFIRGRCLQKLRRRLEEIGF